MRRLTAAQREILVLMAEGRSNTSIAECLHLTPAAVEKRISTLFDRLDLPPSTHHNRRVLAVLHYLRGHETA
ncbi:LuxR C-terminal-related transcriptional regulator [Sinosporangium siamense]